MRYYNEVMTLRAKNIIDEYFANVLTIDVIAHAVHVSREFKRRYGMTFSQYFRDKRILEAIKLINDGGPCKKITDKILIKPTQDCRQGTQRGIKE